MRALNMPAPLSIPPITTARARMVPKVPGPAMKRAASVHAPVVNWAGSIPAKPTARSGTI